MKKNIFFKFLIMVFILLPFYKGEIVRATDYIDVLIIEDSEEGYSVTEGIKNILGFYGAKENCIKDSNYSLGELFNYDKIIIISNNNIENTDLVSDLKEFNEDIFWIGPGVSQILNDTAKERYNVIWNVNNIWNMVIIPNEFESFLTLTEAFNSFFRKENNESFQTFLKITDISTLSDSDKLKEIADYLYDEEVPFIIVVNEISNPKNLNIKENSINYYKTKEFFSTIKYMIDRGGSVVIKNNSNLYDAANNFIRKDYLTNSESEENVLEGFIKECVKNNIYPLGVEVSNKEDFENLKNNFSTFMYSNELSNIFRYPFMITDLKNTYNIITENIGAIDSNNKTWLQNIGYNIKKLSKVKGSIGTISYNSALDIEYLKELVKSLNKENIKYLNLSYMKNKVKLNKIEINSSNGDINCTIDSYYEEDVLKVETEHTYLEKNFFQTKFNIILLISMITLCIVFVLIYCYCKNDNNNKTA